MEWTGAIGESDTFVTPNGLQSVFGESERGTHWKMITLFRTNFTFEMGDFEAWTGLFYLRNFECDICNKWYCLNRRPQLRSTPISNDTVLWLRQSSVVTVKIALKFAYSNDCFWGLFLAGIICEMRQKMSKCFVRNKQGLKNWMGLTILCDFNRVRMSIYDMYCTLGAFNIDFKFQNIKHNKLCSNLEYIVYWTCSSVIVFSKLRHLHVNSTRWMSSVFCLLKVNWIWLNFCAKTKNAGLK